MSAVYRIRAAIGAPASAIFDLSTGLLGGMDAEAQINKGDDDRPQDAQELVLLRLGQISAVEIRLILFNVDLKARLRGGVESASIFPPC